MLAMQYRINLPADYDMEIIRRRVRSSGHLLDHYPGLGVKAFLVRRAGVDGSTGNEYAPFYLWSDTGGAASFLWSGVGFSAITRDFGRPPVQTWVGGTSRSGPAGPRDARYAVRRTRALSDDADLVAATAEADGEMDSVSDEPGVLLAAYGVNPSSWQLVTFTLHAARPEALPVGAVLYEVLHVSAPEHVALPAAVSTRMPAPGAPAALVTTGARPLP